jgi:hypothetical protein
MNLMHWYDPWQPEGFPSVCAGMRILDGVRSEDLWSGAGRPTCLGRGCAEAPTE